MDGVWPWVALALLGAYHGINPAMGWLFAVNLGLQDRDRRSVVRALAPIAIGHELAVGTVAVLVVGVGVLTHDRGVRMAAAVVLIAYGTFRFLKPRAHPRWTKVRVTRRELTLWSFLMSSAHGAGLMVAPVLLGSGAAEAAHAHGGHAVGPGEVAALSLPQAALAVTVHVGAMLAVMAAVALLVYDKLGVRVLRRAWVNTDPLWAAAFVLAGGITLFT
jgi:hypothetical protein